jgi:hypothetical protein
MVQVTMEFEKATKRMFRFKEVTDAEPLIGTLYVSKKAFAGEVPTRIRVTIDPAA